MANIKNTKSNTLLSGTSGNDTIRNGGWWSGSYHDGGSNVTIDGGAGNDYIYNYCGDNVTIDAGAGNDTVYNRYGDKSSISLGDGDDYIENYSGDSVTIDAGTGNDRISLISYANYNVIKYASGDGKDIVYGFKKKFHAFNRGRFLFHASQRR